MCGFHPRAFILLLTHIALCSYCQSLPASSCIPAPHACLHLSVSPSLFLSLHLLYCSLWHSNNAVLAQQSVIISHCNPGANTHIQTHTPPRCPGGKSINSVSAVQHFGVSFVLVCLLQEGEEKVRGLISHQIECMAR